MLNYGTRSNSAGHCWDDGSGNKVILLLLPGLVIFRKLQNDAVKPERERDRERERARERERES